MCDLIEGRAGFLVAQVVVQAWFEHFVQVELNGTQQTIASPEPNDAITAVAETSNTSCEGVVGSRECHITSKPSEALNAVLDRRIAERKAIATIIDM
jgi:hypothetical protein